MILSKKNICNYLIEKDLVSLKSVVEGDLMLRDVSSRNTNFLVNQFGKDGQKLLVKQPDVANIKYVQAMKVEAGIYALIHNKAVCSKIRKYVPQLHQYDDENHILVMEQLSGVCRVFDYLYYGTYYPDKQIIKMLATILKNFHQIPIERAKILTPTYPWFLDIMDKKYGQQVEKDNKKAYKILKPILHNTQVIQFMQESKAMWQSTHFIHLDTRLSNWMMPYTHRAGQKCPIWLIDFELAGIGDAAWDIGFLLGDLLLFDAYLKVKNPKITPNKNYLPISEAIKYFWEISIACFHFRIKQF